MHLLFYGKRNEPKSMGRCSSSWQVALPLMMSLAHLSNDAPQIDTGMQVIIICSTVIVLQWSRLGPLWAIYPSWNLVFLNVTAIFWHSVCTLGGRWSVGSWLRRGATKSLSINEMPHGLASLFKDHLSWAEVQESDSWDLHNPAAVWNKGYIVYNPPPLSVSRPFVVRSSFSPSCPPFCG